MFMDDYGRSIEQIDRAVKSVDFVGTLDCPREAAECPRMGCEQINHKYLLVINCHSPNTHCYVECWGKGVAHSPEGEWVGTTKYTVAFYGNILYISSMDLPRNLVGSVESRVWDCA